jgi:amino acid permease
MARGGHSALQVLPIFVYSYTAHQNFGLLLNELQNPTARRTTQTLTAATGLSLLTYLLLAQAAYFTYGAALQHDLLSSFPASPLSTCLRAAMSLLVTFTYPLQAFPARGCILALWPNSSSSSSGSSSSSSDSSSSSRNKHQFLSFRYTCVTLLFLFSSLLLALLIHDLSLVLEIVGATGSTTVSYLLPGLTYFLLHPWPHARRRLALGQVVIGLVVMLTCLVAILTKER